MNFNSGICLRILFGLEEPHIDVIARQALSTAYLPSAFRFPVILTRHEYIALTVQHSYFLVEL
jgi:hypothetical protein